MSVRHSLVIPVYNEADNLTDVIEAADRVLAPRAGGHEIIIADDGSTDGTADIVSRLTARIPRCRRLALAHHGQASALLTGLRNAQGSLLLTMDGDGQNDPADFPVLIEAVEAGRFDLACGRRVRRHDPWLRRTMSALANGVRRRILGDGVHDAGCQLRVMRREVVGALRETELLQAFIPALAAAAGFRVGEFPVRHHPRTRGRSNYGLGNLWWRPARAMLRLRGQLTKKSP
ncbi:MAG TPA: glycosyltransferase family 2 protein [Candidatus Didemnitutus sp.]|jgi:glycosyltransferase involved in cell wall biosynthesis